MGGRGRCIKISELAPGHGALYSLARQCLTWTVKTPAVPSGRCAGGGGSRVPHYMLTLRSGYVQIEPAHPSVLLH